MVIRNAVGQDQDPVGGAPGQDLEKDQDPDQRGNLVQGQGEGRGQDLVIAGDLDQEVGERDVRGQELLEGQEHLGEGDPEAGQGQGTEGGEGLVPLEATDLEDQGLEADPGRQYKKTQTGTGVEEAGLVTEEGVAPGLWTRNVEGPNRDQFPPQK